MRPLATLHRSLPVLGEQLDLRACLNPPPKSTGTNRTGYYVPDEFAPIGCRNRTDSMQPEKKAVPNPQPLLLFRRTERLDRTGAHKSRLMEMDATADGGGHYSRTNMLL